jgi:hypothetical protein
MKMTVNESKFISAFMAIRPEQFSRPALSALFDYLEELEQDAGEEMELDVIALCCDWSEYETVQEAASVYGWEAPERGDDESGHEMALEWLEDRTQVIQVDSGGVLILQF